MISHKLSVSLPPATQAAFLAALGVEYPVLGCEGWEVVLGAQRQR